MIITEDIFKPEYKRFASYTEEFMQIGVLACEVNVANILCVNPRKGEMLAGLLKHGVIIDSFVSDDEWIDTAKKFSRHIFAGYSHHPLLQITDKNYDMVLVCEDYACVDDCDAMTVQYYRILKKEGVLLCGLWNMSYHENISLLLTGAGVCRGVLENPLHGYATVPVDSFMVRLNEIGFRRAKIVKLYGKKTDVRIFSEASKKIGENLPDSRFLTKINFVKATK